MACGVFGVFGVFGALGLWGFGAFAPAFSTMRYTPIPGSRDGEVSGSGQVLDNAIYADPGVGEHG